MYPDPLTLMTGREKSKSWGKAVSGEEAGGGGKEEIFYPWSGPASYDPKVGVWNEEKEENWRRWWLVIL